MAARSKQRETPAEGESPGVAVFLAGELGAWLVLLGGLGVLALAVLAPAEVELNEVIAERDAVLAEEARRAAWIEAHDVYLLALSQGSEAVLIDLADRQHRLRPAGRRVLLTEDNRSRSADPFLRVPSPEDVSGEVATPVRVAGAADEPSIAVRWLGDRRVSVWALLAGGVCVMWGLLPATRTGPAA